MTPHWLVSESQHKKAPHPTGLCALQLIRLANILFSILRAHHILPDGPIDLPAWQSGFFPVPIYVKPSLAVLFPMSRHINHAFARGKPAAICPNIFLPVPFPVTGNPNGISMHFLRFNDMHSFGLGWCNMHIHALAMLSLHRCQHGQQQTSGK